MPKRSIIWTYFSEIPGDRCRAICTLCCNTYSYGGRPGGSTANLLLHIRSRHPDVTDILPVRTSKKSINIKHDINHAASANIDGDAKKAQAGSCTTGVVEPVNNVPAVKKKVKVTRTNDIKVLKKSSDKPLPTVTNLQSTRADVKTSNNNNSRAIGSSSAPPVAANGARQKLLNKLLLKMIVCDCHSFSIVESDAFRELVAALDRTYTLPTRQTLSGEMLVSTYNQLMRQVGDILTAAEAVSLTTSRLCASDRNFMIVKAHFVTADFKLESCLVEAVAYHDQETAENLCTELNRVAVEWDLVDKVVAVVCDNDGLISEAVKLSGFKHIACFAYSLNELLQQALQLIQPLKDRVKHVIEYFTQTSAAAERLKSIQCQMRPDETLLSLKNDVSTAWTSTFRTFERMIQLQEPLEAAIVEVFPLISLDSDDWDAIKEILLILKPFYIASNEISTEQSVNASKVIMLSRGLMNACHKIEATLTNELSVTVMTQLIERLQQQFDESESDPILARATFLDPRFKKQGFVSDANYNQVFNDIAATLANQISTPDQTDTSTSQLSKTIDEDDLLWDDFDRRVSVVPGTPLSAATSLLRQYVDEPYIGRQEDPLTWWKDHADTYRQLLPVVSSQLCVVATTMRSEPELNRMSSETTQMVLFLKDNYKFLFSF